MDAAEAAHRLNVAEAEVRDIREEAGWFHALVHNMVDHVEHWVRVPETPSVHLATDTGTASGELPHAPAAPSGVDGDQVDPNAQTPESADEAKGSSEADSGQPAEATETPEATEDDPDGSGVDEDGDGVPEGSARQILDWVGDDHERAAAALAAEERKSNPRTSLTSALEKILN